MRSFNESGSSFEDYLYNLRVKAFQLEKEREKAMEPVVENTTTTSDNTTATSDLAKMTSSDSFMKYLY
jgi:hypothetical protein